MKNKTRIERIEQALRVAYSHTPVNQPENDAWEDNVLREIASEKFIAECRQEQSNNFVMRLAWGALAASIAVALFCSFLQVLRSNDNLPGALEEYAYPVSGQWVLEQYAGVDYEE